MACRAKRDQFFFGVVAGVAAKLFVMDLEIRHGAAGLAPPAIPMQNLPKLRRAPFVAGLETALFWAVCVSEPSKDRKLSCIFSQNSGDVYGIALGSRTLITAEMPARPLSIRERFGRVTPRRLAASFTVISPK